MERVRTDDEKISAQTVKPKDVAILGDGPSLVDTIGRYRLRVLLRAATRP